MLRGSKDSLEKGWECQYDFSFMASRNGSADMGGVICDRFQRRPLACISARLGWTPIDDILAMRAIVMEENILEEHVSSQYFRRQILV